MHLSTRLVPLTRYQVIKVLCSIDRGKRKGPDPPLSMTFDRNMSDHFLCRWLHYTTKVWCCQFPVRIPLTKVLCNTQNAVVEQINDCRSLYGNILNYEENAVNNAFIKPMKKMR